MDDRFKVRFWAKVERSAGPSECWPWTGTTKTGGYGQTPVPGKRGSFGAHRIAWELANGRSVPQGLHVCHSCDNPPCCNPDHLWIGTRAMNTLDAVEKGRHPQAKKTHCPKGHPYDKANTYFYKRGGRGCRACRREAARARRAGPIPDSVEHGKLSTYQSYGCRCDPCSAASSAHHAERYRQKKQRREGQDAQTP